MKMHIVDLLPFASKMRLSTNFRDKDDYAPPSILTEEGELPLDSNDRVAVMIVVAAVTAAVAVGVGMMVEAGGGGLGGGGGGGGWGSTDRACASHIARIA